MKAMKTFQLLALIIITIFVLLLRAHTFSSFLLSNFAWTNFNSILRHNSPTSDELRQVVNQFKKAQLSHEVNRSPWLGEGLAHTMHGDIDKAHSSWSTGKIVPDLLTQYGLMAGRRGHFNSALILFRGANILRNEAESEDFYLAGSVCQQTLGSPTLINEKNSQFCAEIIAKNRDNILLNGDGRAKNLYGWQGKHFFADQNKSFASIENSLESNGPVFKLIGYSEGNHFGLFQRVSLPPGITVRFSGRFKVESQENLEARLLYIGWRGKDGKPAGNQAAWKDSDLEWTNFERVFIIPEDATSSTNFYPAVFSGQGTIWFDDVSLELITD
jgi:hypothetical protein